MGKPIKSDVKPLETSALNTLVKKEVLDNFKDSLRYQRYPMNIVLESFMTQYINGRFELDADEIMKFKTDDFETDVLNTTFSREIYLEFKSVCKANGFFVKHVVSAFMEEYVKGDYVLEFKKIK